MKGQALLIGFLNLGIYLSLMNKKIVGYGELLLRLTPFEHGGLIAQSETLKMAFAGAEANITADLALLGHETAFVSALPQNPLGRAANQFLQSFGIDTKAVFLDDGRLGTYFIEHGASIRGTKVTYDRANSSVSNTRILEKNWEVIFSQADYFVLTGITPALSEICRNNIKTALEIAKAKGIKVLFDLNYRRTLWTSAEARHSFETILPFVDLLFANVGSAFDVFDIQTITTDDYSSLELATKQAADALENYGDFEWIAMTMRLQKSADDNQLGGMIKKEKQYYFSPALSTRIVDRLGGGDAFAAATLHGIINDWPINDIVNFSTAAFALTQTIQGDINYLTEKEILEVANGGVHGYVRR